MPRSRLLAAVGFALLAACRTAAPPERAKDATKKTPGPLPPGLDASAIDTSVSPCDDFYRYACGNWLRTAEIPADRASWSRSFDALHETNEKVLHEILEAIAAGHPPPGTPAEPNLGSFYRACMDEPGLEKAIPELKAELKTVERVKDASALAKEVGRMQRAGMAPVFGFGSTQDQKDATQVIGEVDQGGLGLPERDYYTREDEKSKQVRAGYVGHIERMFGLAGRPPAEAAALAKKAMALETRLAEASLTVVERRDPQKLYHRLERAGLEKTAPAFLWPVFFETVGAPASTALNVTHPPFFARVSELVRQEPLDVWRAYLQWVWIRSWVSALPVAFQEEDFRFNSQTFSGAKVDRPRWKKCVALADSEVGEALAQPFVARMFGGDAKPRTKAMIQEIEDAFERNLETLAWMDAPTRARAREKVHTLFNKVGYPDRWRSYAGLELEGPFLTQLMHTQAFEEARRLKKIGRPLDRAEWLLTPQTVNAYYMSNLNDIVFPAGILQPPFFNVAAPDAVNFGAMGMVVGHEITHGFDDEGRQFDAQGNLNEWWTASSDTGFRSRARCVEKQYAEETVIDDLKVRGDLTLGENVADMGGIKLSLAALKHWETAHPALPAATPLSRDQQYFLGFAQSWCSIRRPELARLYAQIDRHSPPALRVNVPLRNSPDFQRAFSCPTGSKMVRADRCEVW